MTTPLPPPPARLEPVAEQLRTEIFTSRNAEWTEKVRRFCSLHGRHLLKKAKERFGAEADAHLQWMASLLLHVPDAYELPCDPAWLSAALYAIDAQNPAPAEQVVKAEEQVNTLMAWHHAGNRLAEQPAQGSVFSYTPGLWSTEARQAQPVLILSPNPFSLYTLSVMQLCLRLNIPIAGLLLRSFTPSRFIAEFRRDGFSLLRKIWRKLILRADENPDSSPLSLSQLLKGLGNTEGDVRKLAQAHNIPVMSAAEWNTEDVATWVKKQSPQIELFTGGGMTRASLQSCFPIGILNVHMGHLPGYKGMDVVQAPVLEGRRNNVGATVHIMDEGLDTGPIIQRLNFNPDPCNSLGTLRNEISGLMPVISIDSALGLSSGRLTPQPQIKGGRQYYFIHSRLQPVLKAAIESHSSNEPGSYNDVYTKIIADLNQASLEIDQ
jgi:methionyl-tRNA formyltransferase